MGGARLACTGLEHAGGWQSFNNPTSKNQGECASFVASHGEKQHNK